MKKSYADMDPTEEMRAIKEELSREFPTARAFGDYVRSKYPMNPSPESPRGRRRTVAESGERPASRRRKQPAEV
jgi:hypothetical protein